MMITKKMTGKEYDAEPARLKARLNAAGSDGDLLRKVAEDMLALCDAATISEVPGLGKTKADVLKPVAQTAQPTPSVLTSRRPYPNSSC